MSPLSRHTNEILETGCDEVGRGCLAGPVVAAAVILPFKYKLPLLNDSKKLKASDRVTLTEAIKRQALGWAIAEVSPRKIETINIAQASYLAMHHALDQLIEKGIEPTFLLIDGPRFVTYRNIPHKCFVKGDSKLASIAAASIIAKTHRDKLMQSLAKEYPDYGWEHNMGYPTLEHRQAIRRLGPTLLHRKTFLSKIFGREERKI